MSYEILTSGLIKTCTPGGKGEQASSEDLFPLEFGEATRL
jgi:hypothetical protein